MSPLENYYSYVLPDRTTLALGFLPGKNTPEGILAQILSGSIKQGTVVFNDGDEYVYYSDTFCPLIMQNTGEYEVVKPFHYYGLLHNNKFVAFRRYKWYQRLKIVLLWRWRNKIWKQPKLFEKG